MRRASAWIPVVAGLAGLVAILVLIAWFVLPWWQPGLVIRHSPFADQVLATDQRISGEDPSWPVRDRLHQGLQGATSAAVRLTASHDPAQRLYGLVVLGTQPASPAVRDAAMRAIAATDPRERRLGVHILPLQGALPADLDAVRLCMADPVSRVQAEAAAWLGRYGDSVDVGRIAALLAGTDRWLARRAAQSLASMNAMSAGSALLQAIREGGRDLLEPALEAEMERHAGFDLHAWLPVIIDGLHDDAVPWNAQQALSWLHRQVSRPEVSAQLMAALDGKDHQQRQLAAQPLWLAAREAHPALVRVSVEALHDDDLPSDGHTRTGGDNALMAFRWLVRADPARTDPALLPLLDSRDQQAQFLAAVVLGCHRAEAHAAGICRVLVPHLSDNQIGQDAVLAVRALFLLGPAAEGHLRDALVGADEQANALIRQIIRDWTDPPRNGVEAARRATKASKISVIMHDAAHEDRLESFTIPRFTR